MDKQGVSSKLQSRRRLPGGFHGSNFSSFHTYVLLQDSDDSERQGLAIRKMYRVLAPGVTSHRREFCHSADALSPSPLKHLLKVEGGAAE